MQISKSRYKRKKNEVVKKDYWVTEQDDFILYLHTRVWKCDFSTKP